ncbi:uncharacterized protein B0H64DRAFT_395214 [Chaetomium fimeti]|uniref:Uncharacterized protein n=1 Tax=Chaetomium fimeti TaxID=1854472 RepID=A0AAE0LS98_9PEZI|nr:hypothetical protein B0H64DRAFT_395214 [Chaetomium fimeti]
MYYLYMAALFLRAGSLGDSGGYRLGNGFNVFRLPVGAAWWFAVCVRSKALTHRTDIYLDIDEQGVVTGLPPSIGTSRSRTLNLA